MQSKTPHLRRAITKALRFLWSFQVLLSIFFALLFLLICEACDMIALPRPHPIPILSYGFLALVPLSLFIIPISTLWARIYLPHSPWACKHALFWAIAMMSASIFSYTEPLFKGFTSYFNEPFLYCIIMPIALGSISLFLVHGIYGLVCFIYRCIYKTLSKRCEYACATWISCIYLVLFLLNVLNLCSIVFIRST